MSLSQRTRVVQVDVVAVEDPEVALPGLTRASACISGNIHLKVHQSLSL
jgi:hypothetical protein